MKKVNQVVNTLTGEYYTIKRIISAGCYVINILGENVLIDTSLGIYQEVID